MFNRHRRLEKHEWDSVRAAREEIAEVLSLRADRADELMNRMLHATYMMLPARLRTEEISVTIDATAVRVHARGVGKARRAALAPHEKVSIEPDAGFWARNSEDHSDDGKAHISRTKYAFELELGVLTSNDPTRPEDIPHIVVGIGHHAPAFGPGKAARAMFENIVSRGLRLDHVIGDRAYLPGAKEADLQNYLRANDAKLVMDYHKNFLGIQDSFGGAIMVDGNWYCASMPQSLIEATIRYRAGEDADEANRTLAKAEREERAKSRREIWIRDVEARAPYLFSRKEKPDGKGRTPWVCPAATHPPLCAHASRPCSRRAKCPSRSSSDPSRARPRSATTRRAQPSPPRQGASSLSTTSTAPRAGATCTHTAATASRASTRTSKTVAPTRSKMDPAGDSAAPSPSTSWRPSS